jgi:hypothetical protein
MADAPSLSTVSLSGIELVRSPNVLGAEEERVGGAVEVGKGSDERVGMGPVLDAVITGDVEVVVEVAVAAASTVGGEVGRKGAERWE